MSATTAVMERPRSGFTSVLRAGVLACAAGRQDSSLAGRGNPGNSHGQNSRVIRGITTQVMSGTRIALTMSGRTGVGSGARTGNRL